MLKSRRRLLSLQSNQLFGDKMADLADLASDNDYNSEILERHKNAKKKKVNRGICLNCGTVLTPSLIYCDLDCKADHEYRLKIKSNQGIK